MVQDLTKSQSTRFIPRNLNSVCAHITSKEIMDGWKGEKEKNKENNGN